MRPFLDELGPDELRTLARIRLAVTARLVALAASRTPELAGLIEKPFRLCLRAPGLPPARLACLGGRVEASAGDQKPVFRGPADLTLRFASVLDCARVLDGAKGRVWPMPGGLGAVRALRFFRSAAQAAPRLLKAKDTPAALRARLLLEAAVSALVETAASDSYTEPKLAHAPDGLVLVDAGEGVRRVLRKRGASLSLAAQPEPTSAEDGQEGGRPDAVLAFQNPEAAVAVLSGKRSAVVALGSLEASIRGLVPLVQSLFAVLDRASQYLAVKAEKEADHGR